MVIGKTPVECGSLFADEVRGSEPILGAGSHTENPFLYRQEVLTLNKRNTAYSWSRTPQRNLFPRIIILQNVTVSRELAPADVIASLTARCRV
jgi:hypothetical protein